MAIAFLPLGSVLVVNSVHAALPFDEMGVRYIAPPEAHESFFVYVVSNDGRLIAGEIGQETQRRRPFVWTPEAGLRRVDSSGLVDGVEEGPFGRVEALSADGRYLAGRVDNPGGLMVGFRYDRESGTQRLIGPPDVDGGPVPGSVLARVLGVSGDGRLAVGQMYTAGKRQAVFWDFAADADENAEGFWNLLSVEDAVMSAQAVPANANLTPWANAVSDDGERIVGFVNAFSTPGFSSNLGFVWDAVRGVRVLPAGGLKHPFEGGETYPAAVIVRGLSGDGRTVFGDVTVGTGTDGLSSITGAVWDFDSLELRLFDIPEGWRWVFPTHASRDGRLITGYVGRPTAGPAEFEAMLWTPEGGTVLINDHLIERFGNDLSGNRIRFLSVAPEGKVFSGVAETESGLQIIQLWPSPLRTTHAYPPPGFGEPRTFRHVARSGGLIAGGADLRPGVMRPYFWTEAGGFAEFGPFFDGEPEEALSTGFVQTVSADGRVLYGIADHDLLGFPTSGFLRWDRDSDEVFLLESVMFQAVATSADGSRVLGAAQVSNGAADAVIAFFDSSPGENPPEMTILGVRQALETSGILVVPPLQATIVPTGLSDDGRRAVGYVRVLEADNSRRFHGFVWEETRGARFMPADGAPISFGGGVGGALHSVYPHVISGGGSTVFGWIDELMADDTTREWAVRWDFESLEMEILGQGGTVDGSRLLSASRDGRLALGSGRRPLGEGPEASFENVTVLWTPETGFVALEEYLRESYGVPFFGSYFSSVHLSNDGRHLLGWREWGDRRELVRISRAVAFASPADLPGELRDLGHGWTASSWFGVYWSGAGDWIYHAEHGWLYPFGFSEPQRFFYDAALSAWFWTGPALYPWAYGLSPQVDGWVAFDAKGGPGNRHIYFVNSGQWVHEATLQP